MDIKYITTDLEIESSEDLIGIVQELGDSMVIQLNQWVDGTYRVSVSGTGSELNFTPEQTINEFCDAIDKLSENSQALWHRCIARVADIAFESGNEPNHLTYHLPASLINRLSGLRVSIAITIYPIGTYSYESNDKTNEPVHSDAPEGGA